MANNIFTALPNVGDAVVSEKATKKVRFITKDSFNLATLNSDAYETVGVVYNRRGKKVKIAYKENSSQQWASKWIMKLSGYTLDGSTRSGVISFRESSSSSDNTDVTVSYKATTLQGLADALNSAFLANETMSDQHWVAYIKDEGVYIEHDYTFWQQSSYNGGKSGFSTDMALMPEVEAIVDIRRRHGGSGGEGVISSWDRALSWYRASTSTVVYMGYVPSPLSRASDRQYPIALQSYLGINCKEIRKVFGEGEQGWLKCMASYLPVKPTDYGNMGMRDGLVRTMLLASYTDTSGQPLAPAAYYCYNIDTIAISKGNWYLPTVEDLADLLEVIKYGTDGSRTSDPVNKTLLEMGGSAISNGSYLWSCCRYWPGVAWFAYGDFGFFYNLDLFNWLVAVPVSLYILED